MDKDKEANLTCQKCDDFKRDECQVSPISSRVCDRGTKSCTVQHREPDDVITEPEYMTTQTVANALTEMMNAPIPLFNPDTNLIQDAIKDGLMLESIFADDLGNVLLDKVIQDPSAFVTIVRRLATSNPMIWYVNKCLVCRYCKASTHWENCLWILARKLCGYPK